MKTSFKTHEFVEIEADESSAIDTVLRSDKVRTRLLDREAERVSLQALGGGLRVLCELSLDGVRRSGGEADMVGKKKGLLVCPPRGFCFGALSSECALEDVGEAVAVFL